MKTMTLDEWERAVLPKLSQCEFKPAPIDNVTLLAYFFWDDDRIETKFYTIECTFLCAYHAFGLAPSVLVVNKTTPHMVEFCHRYNIDLQVDPTLTGGLPRMNIDCIRTIHLRTKTDYAIVLESDGIVINSGLEKFVGPWDYVGAPWTKDNHGPWWSHRYRYPVGNSGLCIRSRRIGEAAAAAYDSFWCHLPYSWFVNVDVFICKTMRFFGGRKWRQFRFPDIPTAAAFSVENTFADGVIPSTPPIGFHSEHGFRNYVNAFGLPFADLLG